MKKITDMSDEDLVEALESGVYKRLNREWMGMIIECKYCGAVCGWFERGSSDVPVMTCLRCAKERGLRP